MANRPTFDYHGHPVRAAGIMIYTIYRGKKLRLFRIVNNKMEDIGGKKGSIDAWSRISVPKNGNQPTSAGTVSPNKPDGINVRLFRIP